MGLTAVTGLGAVITLLSLLGPRTQGTELLLSLWGVMTMPALVLTTVAFVVRARWASIFGLVSSGLMLVGTLPHLTTTAAIPEPAHTLVWSNVLGKPDAIYNTIAYAEDMGADLVLVGEWPKGAPVELPEGWRLVSASCRGQPVTALSRASHMLCERPSTDRRGSVVLTLGDTTVVATHASAPFVPNGVPNRALHLEEAATLAAARTPAVIVGDFNTVPWSPAFQPLQKAGFERAPIGAKATWLGKHHTTGLAIDHAFGRDVDLEMRVGPHTGSDHYPILVRINPA
ncbi:MAG: endonuclease/exonuclease/phosphatase family protein [Pseudomonadota bacterium]